ncbi:MAG: TIGR01244 family sulfur transferase [Pseudomonadota bacterium]
MDIRTITPDYAVTPQIEPDDIPAIKEAGFTTVICNRPDGEVPMELHGEVLKAAVEAAGLTFVDNPLVHAELSMGHVERQAAAQKEAAGPVLAYCASGTRSSILWSLSQAGQMTTEDILAATTKAGYELSHLQPQLEALAKK